MKPVKHAPNEPNEPNEPQALTHRQRQALATQQLVVAAARDLFLEQGYTATSIEAIAAQAGVAVSTVYAIFKNKRAILTAIRQAWHDESGQREIYQAAMQESDARRRLEMAAHATRRQWEFGAAMIAIYESAAAVDKEAAAEQQVARTGRRTNMRRFIDGMAEARMLRPDLDVARASAIFLSLTLVEIYWELVDEAGWSADAYEAWLTEALKRELLG